MTKATKSKKESAAEQRARAQEWAKGLKAQTENAAVRKGLVQAVPLSNESNGCMDGSTSACSSSRPKSTPKKKKTTQLTSKKTGGGSQKKVADSEMDDLSLHFDPVQPMTPVSNKTGSKSTPKARKTTPSRKTRGDLKQTPAKGWNKDQANNMPLNGTPCKYQCESKEQQRARAREWASRQSLAGPSRNNTTKDRCASTPKQRMSSTSTAADPIPMLYDDFSGSESGSDISSADETPPRSETLKMTASPFEPPARRQLMPEHTAVGKTTASPSSHKTAWMSEADQMVQAQEWYDRQSIPKATRTHLSKSSAFEMNEGSYPRSATSTPKRRKVVAKRRKSESEGLTGSRYRFLRQEDLTMAIRREASFKESVHDSLDETKHKLDLHPSPNLVLQHGFWSSMIAYTKAFVYWTATSILSVLTNLERKTSFAAPSGHNDRVNNVREDAMYNESELHSSLQ